MARFWALRGSILDQFFRLTRALEGKVDQSFGDPLSDAARERARKRERENDDKNKLYIKLLELAELPINELCLADVSSSLRELCFADERHS